MVTIRPGTSSDRSFVTDLGLRTIASSESAVRPADRRELEKNYERLVDFVFGSSHVLLVAESPMERIGFLVFLDEVPDEVSGERQAFVAYMAVEPHAVRHGVGKMLLEKAEEAARERGLPSIALMVTEGNDPARALYAQAGFVTERRLLVKNIDSRTI